MKTKTVVAKDMRQALKKITEELGADAVILSNKKVDGGIEVTASLDYDRALEEHRQHQKARERSASLASSPNTFKPQQGDVQRLLKRTLEASKSGQQREQIEQLLSQQTSSASQPTVKPYQPPVKATTATTIHKTNSQLADELKPDTVNLSSHQKGGEQHSKVLSEPVDDAIDDSAEFARNDASLAFRPAATSSMEMNAMRSELQLLRSMLNTQLGNVAWGDFSYRNPESAAIFKRLIRMGFDSALSRSLSGSVVQEQSKKENWQRTMGELANSIPVVCESSLPQEGVVAFVGPAGVGKTTTIAKLAAKYVLEHGPESVAMITTDTYRIAGHEQLRTLSKILKIPLRLVSGGQSLDTVIRGLAHKKMIFIDTAGLSHKDESWSEQLETLKNTHTPIQKWLVLSTTSQKLILEKAIADYKNLILAGCVLTKLDESASLGESLSVVIEHDLSIAYTTNGQNVPDDIETAKPRRLINQAILLSQEIEIDSGLVAERFSNSTQNGVGQENINETFVA